MTIEKFLLFWDHYNVHIIEGLLATIVVLALVQAYRLFLSRNDGHDEVSGGAGFDAAHIEKTLQKILDAQKNASASGAAPAGSAKPDEHAVAVDLSKFEGSDKEAIAAIEAKAAAQVAQLQAQLDASAKQVVQLQEQLKAAGEGGAPAPAAAAPAGDGAAAAASAAELSALRSEKDALNEKIRELEARLAEYEIISEDIADLSKYREENDSLKSELEKLKAGAPAPAAPATPVEVAPPAPAPVAEAPAPAAAEPAVAAAPEVAAEPEVSPVAAAEAAAEAAAMAQQSTEEAKSADLIDDELMKEFEAAVAGQKNLSQAADKATTAEGKPAQGDETEKLMGEFENFVNKKS